MLGMGPRAEGAEVDPDLVNAGKVPVTELPGAAYFHQADSFAMMRGGHLDLCVLGAYQVSATGDLANWHTDRLNAVPAVGGAMDLAVGARTVYVMMSLFDKSGNSKLVPECTYPITARGCVDRVYSDHAIVDLTPDGAVVLETYGSTVDQLARRLPVRVLRP
jgi:3-oxoadipate CoA-transferase beta subunit